MNGGKWYFSPEAIQSHHKKLKKLLGSYKDNIVYHIFCTLLQRGKTGENMIHIKKSSLICVLISTRDVESHNCTSTGGRSHKSLVFLSCVD